jgi:transcriptional regulator with XRE-family HTH domain
MANERLRTAILQRRVTIDDLAVAAGVDPKTAERWVTVSRIPYRRHRYAVANLLQMDEIYLWPDALTHGQLIDASESEIIAVYPHRHAVPKDLWERLFGSAEAEIAVLVYSGFFLADDPGLQALLATKARDDVRVRILLGDPDSAQVGVRGADEGINEGLAAKIRNVIVMYAPLRKVGGVEIRLHSTVLYNSMHQADDELLVNSHVYGAPASMAPALHLRKVAGGSMVTTFLNSYERVWSQARPLD